MRSQNALLMDDPTLIRKEYATILAFDVKTLPEAKLHAQKVGVKILEAEIIYHLCDMYKKWVVDCQQERKNQTRADAVFPCVIKPIAFFNKKDPIVLGCDVVEGVVKIGTPLCVFNKDKVKVNLGTVVSIEANHKPIQEARAHHGNIAIRIKGEKDSNITAGRQFELTDAIYSLISRKNIDVLKANFRNEMLDSDWETVIKLKELFDIF